MSSVLPIILAIDTTGVAGSLSLLKGGELINGKKWEAQTGHSSQMAIEFENLCRENSLLLSQIDFFAVTVGPGSFTGIRVGLSFVKGLALGLNKPVVGVSTLSALAEAVGVRELDEYICPMIDARREEVYTALYRRDSNNILTSVLKERSSSIKDFLDIVQKNIDFTSRKIVFLGSGARKYLPIFNQYDPVNFEVLPSSFDAVQTESVGKLGFQLWKEGHFFQKGIDLLPNYLRASEVERKNSF